MCWQLNDYLSEPTVTQLGWKCCNTQAVYYIQTPLLVRRQRYLPQDVEDFPIHILGQRPVKEGVRELDTVKEDLLDRTVVLVQAHELVDPIFESCLEHQTPLVVNWHPDLVRRLGHRYPGFYHELAQVRRLLIPSIVYRMHRYLSSQPCTSVSWESSSQSA